MIQILEEPFVQENTVQHYVVPSGNPILYLLNTDFFPYDQRTEGQAGITLFSENNGFLQIQTDGSTPFVSAPGRYIIITGAPYENKIGKIVSQPNPGTYITDITYITDVIPPGASPRLAYYYKRLTVKCEIYAGRTTEMGGTAQDGIELVGTVYASPDPVGNVMFDVAPFVRPKLELEYRVSQKLTSQVAAYYCRFSESYDDGTGYKENNNIIQNTGSAGIDNQLSETNVGFWGRDDTAATATYLPQLPEGLRVLGNGVTTVTLDTTFQNIIPAGSTFSASVVTDFVGGDGLFEVRFFFQNPSKTQKYYSPSLTTPGVAAWTFANIPTDAFFFAVEINILSPGANVDFYLRQAQVVSSNEGPLMFVFKAIRQFQEKLAMAEFDFVGGVTGRKFLTHFASQPVFYTQKSNGDFEVLNTEVNYLTQASPVISNPVLVVGLQLENGFYRAERVIQKDFELSNSPAQWHDRIDTELTSMVNSVFFKGVSLERQAFENYYWMESIVPFTELQPFHFRQVCENNVRIDFVGPLGNWETWYFDGPKTEARELGNELNIQKDVFLDGRLGWEQGQTLDERLKIDSTKTFSFVANRLTKDEARGLAFIKVSPLVQLVHVVGGKTVRTTVIVDSASFTYVQDAAMQEIQITFSLPEEQVLKN